MVKTTSEIQEKEIRDYFYKDKPFLRNMPKVAVIKAKRSTIIKDYARVMQLADYKKHLPKKQELILKLNLSWSLYYPACSTQPWQLDGVLNVLTKDNYKIHPVENKTVVTDVWKGAQGNKWLPILKKYNLKYEPLTETEWIPFKAKKPTPAIDHVFGDTFTIPKIFLKKNILQLPTLKTHGHTKLTVAIKNAFGGLITTRRHHAHKMIHEILVDLLQIQKEIHPHLFAVADGTVCGDGNGPRTMIPRIKNYILASADQVAIDAVSAKMMGFDPMKIKFLRLAHDKSLGCADLKQIEIVGENIEKVNFHFKTGKSPVIYFDQLLRKKIKFFEPLLFHTPLFNICIAGSYVYHDYIWYPTIGKIRINKFIKTEWGSLFKKY